MIVNRSQNIIYSNKNIAKISKKPAIANINKRQQLANVLFKGNFSNNITFGWSKYVRPGSQEEKILDTLSDPSIKNAVVMTHNFPDPDALGSSMGISGTLKSLGINVVAISEKKPPAMFENMPTPEENTQICSYIQDTAKIANDIESGKINTPDVAIITDTAEPYLTNKRSLDIAAKAKKVIIIDHHRDSLNVGTNESHWVRRLTKRGVAPENILYWREVRESASEMIGEIDREFFLESQNIKNAIPHYNPNTYPGYRLAIAAGIIGDVGAINTQKGQTDNIKLIRLSKKKIQTAANRFQSITRNIFNWAIAHCGIPKNEINLKAINSLEFPKIVDEKIDRIIDGTFQAPGIETGFIGNKEIGKYIFIKNTSYLEHLAMKTRHALPECTVKASDIAKEILNRCEKKIIKDKDQGLFVLATKAKNDSFFLSVRSYGYNNLLGEAYIPKHVITEGLAIHIVNELKQTNLGDGGGHNNAAGFRSINNQVSFKKDTLPVIVKALNKYCSGKDLTAIPKKLNDNLKKLNERRNLSTRISA